MSKGSKVLLLRNLVAALVLVCLNLVGTASTQTFSFTSNLGGSGVGTLSLVQGNQGTINLAVQSTDGFVIGSFPNQQTALPLTYSYTGAPAETQVLFSPSATDDSSITPTITVRTTAPTHASLRHQRGSQILYAAFLPGLLGVAFLAGSRKRCLRGMSLLGLIFTLGVSTLGLGSCGGSNNSSSGNLGTPVGSYNVTINATTGGSSPISANYQFKLTVTSR